MWRGNTTNGYDVGVYANYKDDNILTTAPSAPIIQEAPSAQEGKTVLRLVYPKEGNNNTAVQVYAKYVSFPSGPVKGHIVLSKENAFTDAENLSVSGWNGTNWVRVVGLTSKLNSLEVVNTYRSLEFDFNNPSENSYQAIMITYKAGNQNNTIRIASLDFKAQALTDEDREKINTIKTTGDGTKYLADDGTYKTTSSPSAILTFDIDAGETLVLNIFKYINDTSEIDWGDGTITTATKNTTDFYSHKYAQTGTYRVKVYNVFETVGFDSTDPTDTVYHTKLRKVEIISNIATLLKRVFKGCTNLTEVILGDCVREMGAATFLKCNSLTTVKIGCNFNYIGKDSFYNLPNLKAIYFDVATPPVVSTALNAINANKTVKYIVPKGSLEAYRNAPYWSNKKNFIVSAVSDSVLTDTGDGTKYLTDDGTYKEVQGGMDLVIEAITNPSKTLTDEEKASALEWLGAVDKVKNKSDFNRVYGIMNGTTNTAAFDIMSPTQFGTESDANRRTGIASYSNGKLGCATPDGDYQAANKKYVDDSFAWKTKDLEIDPDDGWQYFELPTNTTEFFITGEITLGDYEEKVYIDPTIYGVPPQFDDFEYDAFELALKLHGDAGTDDTLLVWVEKYEDMLVISDSTVSNYELTQLSAKVYYR